MNFAQYLATPVKPLFDHPVLSEVSVRRIARSTEESAVRQKEADERYRLAFLALGGKATVAELADRLGNGRKTVNDRIIGMEGRGKVKRAGAIMKRGGRSTIWKWNTEVIGGGRGVISSLDRI